MISLILIIILIIFSLTETFTYLPTDDFKKDYKDSIYLEINKKGLKWCIITMQP